MSDEVFLQLMALVNERSQPNSNAIWRISKDIEASHLNIKFFGYHLAKQLADALPIRTDTKAHAIGLCSSASTQAAIESEWVAHWCAELQIPVVFHRKIWELAFALQALWETDKIGPGRKGIGFGCGEEPLPSYLAAKGCEVTVTDMPPENMLSAGWARTAQHTASRDMAFHPNLVDRDRFESSVSLKYVDMNAIPDDLVGYDFCWSICALEHLGTLQRGMDFIEHSLKVLKPGGVAVHTTEYNFLNDNETIDNWNTVLFQRRHFSEIRDRLTSLGHHVAPLDFSVGDKPLDKFIDLPPFVHDWPPFMQDQWAGGVNHIKVQVDGFPCTCFGLLITKG